MVAFLKLSESDVDKKIKGIVLRFERTSIHDGEGLRTVIFLKGCPLRCLWCSTPESINPSPEIGYDVEACAECYSCVAVCPTKAIGPLVQEKGIFIRKNVCNFCFSCVVNCPHNALKAYGCEMNVESVLKEVEKDGVFFYHSNGGVTLSGGEPLLQAEFCGEILKGCQTRGINTAVETSSFVPWDNYQKVLPYLDAVYTDIKCLDPNTHRKLTSQSNDLILSNIRRIDRSEYNVELVIRIPLIPGINDSADNLMDTLEFCRSLKKISKLELLPYHRLGVKTYKFLGIPYVLGDVESASIEWAEEKANLLREESVDLDIVVSGNY